MKIKITENDLFHMINEVMDMINPQDNADEFYEKFSDGNGYVDEIAIVKDCLDSLKRCKDVISPEHEIMRLDNGCKVRMQWNFVEDNDFANWEIWLPDGDVIDGFFAEDDNPDGMDDNDFEMAQRLDYDFQEEIHRHVVR